MCGIAGILFKNGKQVAPLGRALQDMASILGSRGLDSTGVALYGAAPERGIFSLRVHVKDGGGIKTDRKMHELREVLDDHYEVKEITYVESTGRIVLVIIPRRPTLGTMLSIAHAVESVGCEVLSLGRTMEILKDMGSATAMNKFKVSEFNGTHGLAHTRLATESIVNVCYSHPFWARPFPDIAVVHNGQLTNHNTLRRSLQRRGYEFRTTNDSEVIGIFVADRLLAGATLHDALTESIEVLDGTFTYLVTTGRGIGFAKDRFSTKPLVVAEDEDFVAMASEEVALRNLVTEKTSLYEPTARAVRTWQL